MYTLIALHGAIRRTIESTAATYLKGVYVSYCSFFRSYDLGSTPPERDERDDERRFA